MQLHRDRDEFEAVGVRLAVIGQGTPAHAADFRRSQKVDFQLLVDPERRTYRAVGARKATVTELLGPTVLARGLTRGLAAGVRQGRTIGDAAQLGGVMIVAPDGSVPYARMAEDASDNPPNEEVLEAARTAVGSG